MTIEDYLRQARLDNKLLELELLLAFYLKKDRAYILSHPELQISGETEEVLQKDYKKLKKDFPLAYITNNKEFYSRDFYVDERVLVPRPETESMLDEILKFYDDKQTKYRIVDIGCGSACIGMSLGLEFMDSALARENLAIDLIDISEDALAVANINTEKFSMTDLVRLHKSNLLADFEIPQIEEEYLIITANLPYIGLLSNNFVQDSVKDYEPDLALFAGNDGLDLYRELFQQLSELRFDLLAIEYSHSQLEAVEDLVQSHFPAYSFYPYTDLAGLNRGAIIKL